MFDLNNIISHCAALSCAAQSSPIATQGESETNATKGEGDSVAVKPLRCALIIDQSDELECFEFNEGDSLLIDSLE